jgi:hypothetical protein
MFGLNKRKYQEKLNNILGNDYQKGAVLGLAGPEPEKWIESLFTSKIGDYYYLYEIKLDQYLKGRERLKEKGYDHSLAQINHKDIFSERANCDTNISGIDLDFCECLRTDLAIFIGVWLEKILTNTKNDNIWIRVTSSIGHFCGEKQILNRLEKVLDYIKLQTKFEQINKPVSYTYRDTRTMLVWQVQLTKENKMKKRTKKRVMSQNHFGDLTPYEKESIRARLGRGEDPEVIGREYRLYQTSVAALKAHQTMGSY